MEFIYVSSVSYLVPNLQHLDIFSQDFCSEAYFLLPTTHLHLLRFGIYIYFYCIWEKSGLQGVTFSVESSLKKGTQTTSWSGQTVFIY